MCMRPAGCQDITVLYVGFLLPKPVISDLSVTIHELQFIVSKEKNKKQLNLQKRQFFFMTPYFTSNASDKNVLCNKLA